MLASLAALVAVVLVQETPSPPPPPRPVPLADRVWLVPGAVVPPRQPDGNTVIFVDDRGLVVVDTGRHAWHRQAIEDFARSRGLALDAILNTHWHLDHISGNRALKAAHPGVRVYATSAIDGAVEGFLRGSAADGAEYLAQGQVPAELAEDIRGDIASVEAIDALKPDVRVDADRSLEISGRTLQLRVAARAATEADLWVFDPASGLAIVGDLVTLPAPFLDTACPEGWAAALDQIAATPFERVVPGHGPVLSRDQFNLWRAGFTDFIACGESQTTPEDCAVAWTGAIRPLLPDDAAAKQSTRMAAYYVAAVLRSTEARARSCRPAPPAGAETARLT